MLILRTIFEQYDRFLLWYIDPRISHYFLMGSPLTIIWISIVYWLFIKKIGPKLMENRRPFELRNAMLVYNSLQVLFNIFIIYKATCIVIRHPLYADWSCMRYDRNSTNTSDTDCAYLYALLKLIDYMDTIFMVLRKRFNQVTFLHVYHHILMGVGSTLFLPVFGAGHYFALGYINCYVHTVMYTYYFLAALNTNIKKSLWWKKHLTQLQIIQFVILVFHFARALFNKNCDQSQGMLLFSTLQTVLMLILFSNFYIKAYINKPNERKTT